MQWTDPPVQYLSVQRRAGPAAARLYVNPTMEDCAVVFVHETEIRESVCAAFDEMRAQLEELLPRARIEHVGSTSVPGSITKGDLDICVLVGPGAFESAEGVLANRFSRNAGSDRTDSFASFVAAAVGRIPVGIQLVLRGGQEDDFLRWRDLLRGSLQTLEAYNDLKRQWHGRPHDQYRRAKSRFIAGALSSAPD
jgi:GrpB-like predicted nucleotidyltransferase (UPF0157 family)